MPGGRPLGTTESPESLIRREVQQMLKLSGRIREMVDEQLDILASPAITPTELDTVAKKEEILTRMLDLVIKSIREMAKFVLETGAAQQEPSNPETSAVKELMEQLRRDG